MAACQTMAMCSSSQPLHMKLEGHPVLLPACKCSCFCGAASHLPVALSLQGWSTSSNRHRVVVRAQDARKGTRIFKFNKKQGVDETPEAKPGTRLFRFGGPKKQEEDVDEQEEEEDNSPISKFGTQLFKNLGRSSKKKSASGTAKGGALIVPAKELSFSLPRRQDPRTVFVAGATGQIGARIVQKLLRQGFSIRAGVRDLFVAQQLAEFATQYGVVSREEAKRLNAVEFDFKNVESIAKAIGGAAKVVVTIGPSEDGPKSKVSFLDACNVVEAAKLANIANLVVVYEPGTSAGDDNPLSNLASFFTGLFSKPTAVSISELLDQIVDSDMSYTLLKTSMTDGIDDISPATQNIDLRKEGTAASPISKGQVASIVAEIVANPAVAENKVIEASTSSSTAVVPLSELLSSIPVDGRREAMAAARAKAEEKETEKAAREKAEADARAAVEDARNTAQLAAQLEAEAKQLTAAEAKAASVAEKAQAQAAAAAASVEGLAARIKDLPGTQKLFSKAKGGDMPRPALPAFSLPAFPSMSKAKINPPATTSSSKASAPSPPPKKQQREPIATPSAPKPQINSIFGGLFNQETIYVDEV